MYINIRQTRDKVQCSVCIPKDHLLNSINLFEQLSMETHLNLKCTGTPTEKRKQPRIIHAHVEIRFCCAVAGYIFSEYINIYLCMWGEYEEDCVLEFGIRLPPRALETLLELQIVGRTVVESPEIKCGRTSGAETQQTTMFRRV